MPLYLTILEGNDPETAEPVFASRDSRLIADVARALTGRLDADGGRLRAARIAGLEADLFDEYRRQRDEHQVEEFAGIPDEQLEARARDVATSTVNLELGGDAAERAKTRLNTPSDPTWGRRR